MSAQADDAALPKPGATVVGEGGLRAEVEQVLADGDRLIARLPNGRRVLLPCRAIFAQGDRFRIKLSLDDVRHADAQANAAPPAGSEARVIPVIEERVHVDKRPVERGRVRVRKTVSAETRDVEQNLLRQDVDVERVPRGTAVDASAPPEARWEGDTYVVPLLEEVLVVEKRLVLREEVRLTRRHTTRAETQQVTLRREEATVDRLPPSGAESQVD